MRQEQARRRAASIYYLFIVPLIAFGAVSPALAADVKLTDEASVDAVVAAMTIEEKAKAIAGMGMSKATNIRGVAGSTYAIPRLGIPEVVYADGPVGLRLGASAAVVGNIDPSQVRYTTAFPVTIAVASSWNPDLASRIGAAIGDECRAFGVDVLLAPGINIQRDPLNGRNFEYFSEDPYLTGTMASAFVNGIQERGVGATVKHFAVNNQETARRTINEVVSERALREIYLSAFEMVVKDAKPWALMSSYPSVNGTFASQNPYLLTDILRREWGFSGFVMSDWWGVRDPLAALPAGNDLAMPGGARYDGTIPAPEELVLAALKTGALEVGVVDENIRRILRAVLKTGAFKGNKPTNKPDLTAAIGVARSAASEGMVLLRNEAAALPLAAGAKVAVFGRNARSLIIIGGGSAEVNADPARIVALLDGFKQDGLTTLVEANGTPLLEGVSNAAVNAAADQADVAILSFGRDSSEGTDRYSMDMHKDELALIKAVSIAFHAKGKKVVVLLNVGAPIEVASWRESVDAILLTWLPGQEAGLAVADVVTGRVNPSGKLPITFPKKYTDSPTFGNFPGYIGAPPGYRGTVIYGEGIYVGYRYYDTKEVEPAYAFGHGLSYTTFAYGNARIGAPSVDLDKNDSVMVSVDVTNSGKVAGQEVVQLYVRDEASRLDRPYQELKGYQKVALSPGESKTVRFTLDRRALSAYDPMRKSWLAEPGRFSIGIGASSRDIRATLPLRATGNAAEAIGLSTPWLMVQTYPKAAAIVAQYLGDAEVNAWISGTPTLGDKLTAYFAKKAELKGDVAKQRDITGHILAEIGDL